MYQVETADRIIRNAARRFSPSFRGYKDFEDLVQDGHIEAAKLESQGKLKEGWEALLTVWIRSCWLNELKGLRMQKRDRSKEVRIDNEGFDRNRLSFNPSRFVETWAFLSEEIQTIALLLLNSPQELIELVKLHNVRVGINLYLKGKGWSKEQLEVWKKTWEEAEIA